jgi:hypothetical protein
MLSEVTSFFGGLFKGAATWVEGKGLLIIGYILVALLVAVAGYSVNSYVQIKTLQTSNLDLSSQLGGVAKDLSTVVKVNQTQQDAIDQLRDLRKTDASAIQGLQTELGAHGIDQTSVKAKVSQLEKNNATAKSVLDAAVPRDLGCVRNDEECPPAVSGGTDKK